MGCSIGLRRSFAAQLRFGAAAAAVLWVGCGFESTPVITKGSNAPVNIVDTPSLGTPGSGTPGADGTGAPINGVPASSVTIVPGALPCGVETVVKNRCQNCHRATPIGGAPNALVSLSDFRRDYTVVTTQALSGKTVKLYELARIRINAELGAQRMPAGGQLSRLELDTMNEWFTNGAPAGEACAATIPGGGINKPDAGATAGQGGTTPTVVVPERTVVKPDTADECENDPAQFEPLEALPGETCYEFTVHGASSPTDTTKFTVINGESYNQFYYDVPWPAGTLATRFGAKFDNLQVAHHWLGFSSAANVAAGTVQNNVLGTTLGESAELIGGWAVGGCNIVFPKEMGLKLPDTGKIMIQWHHFNSTGTVQKDATAVQWCTVPPGGRPNVGGLTFLGTEFFNGLIGMPAGQKSKFSGSCTNNSGKPITLVGFYPHMHLLGIDMKSEVTRVDGTKNMVFDHAFAFDYQVNYMLNPGYVLQPGDKITSTCTFNNTTAANVAFGQSTKQEMCYQFTFAYPYDALNNGVLSLIGATNTCW